VTKTAENNQFYKGKRPLVYQYLTTAKEVEGMAAMRGHLYRPGFLGGMITSVERELKFGLSDLNYQIVSDAVSRELVQTGHSYDISYKESRIAWELEKATIYTALEQEFLNNKRVRDLDNQELERMGITVDLRRLVLIAAKTAIDVEMETETRKKLSADRSTFDTEDLLTVEKLKTAERKLEVIDVINEILVKQQDIIDAETENASRKNDLIGKKEDLNDERLALVDARGNIAGAIVELIAAKEDLVEERRGLIIAKGFVADQEIINVGYLDQYISALGGLTDVQQDLIGAKRALIPKINEKSMALIAYTAELDAWVIVKKAIAVLKEEIAGYMEDRVDKKSDVMDSRGKLEDLKLDLQEAQINLEIARMTGKNNLMGQNITNAAKMLTERQTSFDAKLSRESGLLSGQIDLDLYESQVAFETMEEVNDIAIPSQLASIRKVGGYRVITKRRLGEIAANAKLTSSLIHLLK